MISHKHRCIFIHIPRTGGTSIEVWLTGKNWADAHPELQHPTASQARELYADYWDDYFKFSFVRHPVARALSCLVMGEGYGLHRDGDTIDFTGYHERFGRDIVTEYDYRFFGKPEHGSAPQPHTVYGNMLDLPLDFIGRTEDIAKHTGLIQQILGVEQPFDAETRHVASRVPQDWNLSDATFDHIESIYRADYDRFFYNRRKQTPWIPS
jgi:hypothetical protein